MIYIGYFLLAFAALRSLIAFINLISFHYLPRKIKVPLRDKISVLIPVRNEEKNLEVLLNDLSTFRHTELEILLYNDESTDSSVGIIKSYMKRDQRIRLSEGILLPDGWLGKNHACQQLAMKATGDYFLFLDADVRVKEGLVEKAVSYLKQKKLHLLSIFPKQIMVTRGEKISVPLMNWILLSLLPLFLIRISRNKSLAAANGQFMLFRKDTYLSIMPHQLFKCNAVEDIAILRHFKKLRLRSDTLLGNELIKCRMYHNLNEARQGFAKNLIHFFGNKRILAVFFGLITSFGLILVCLINGLTYGGMYLLMIIMTRILVAAASGQNILMNLIFIIPQQIIFMDILINSLIRQKKGSLIWKERTIA